MVIKLQNRIETVFSRLGLNCTFFELIKQVFGFSKKFCIILQLRSGDVKKCLAKQKQTTILKLYKLLPNPLQLSISIVKKFQRI